MMKLEEVLNPKNETRLAGVIVPVRPFLLWENRLADAWAVFTGRAVAVQWPDQEVGANDR